MADAPNYLTEEWTREAIDKAAAWLLPAITAKYEKEGTPEQVSDFSEIVIPELDSNIWKNLATFMTPIINGAIQVYLNEAAMAKGERTTVIKHDGKGRIAEFVKTPLWAEVKVAPSELPQGEK